VKPISAYLFFLFLLPVLVFSCKTKQVAEKELQSSPKHIQNAKEIEFKNYYFDGIREKTLGNWETAAKYFLKCVQINPNHAPSNYELAYIYNTLNKVPEALVYAQNAYKQDPKNEWYASLYAQTLQRKEEYSEACKIYQQNAKLNNNKPEILYNWANALLLAGKYKDALKVFDLIEQETGINEEVVIQKERIYLKLGQIEQAANELKKLIDLNPQEPRYLGLLADLYTVNGQSQKAYEYFEKILAIDPENGYVHLSLADYYRNLGNNEKSEQELKKAFANNQIDIDTKMRILLNFFDISEKDLSKRPFANELLQLLVQTHANEAKSYSIQGDFLYRDKKIKEARDSFKKAAELDNTRFVIWNQIILLDFELNDFDDMYLSGKKAIELFPNQPNLYLYTGISCMQKKNYIEAINYFKNGLNLVIDNNPLKVQFYSYLGDCYHAIKDYSNSDANYEKALKIDPQNIYVLNNYAYYLSLRSENLEKAEEMSKKTLTLEPNTPNYEDTYAWILFKMNKYSDARLWLEKAINNGGGGNPTILEHLGDVYFKLNMPDKALEYWKKAAEKSDSEILKKKIKEQKWYE
jgi:tetratricopeptide (TPR) repeat protein